MSKTKYFLRCSLVLVAALIFSNSYAQNTFRATTKTVIGFLEYLPQDYLSNSNKYPIVIFLHGLGERGPTTTSLSSLKAGIGTVERTGTPKHVKYGTEFPFILISPQLKNCYTDWPTWYVLEIIDYCKTYLRIDERRIYLMGLSLGGGGTWTSSLTYPTLFAAIAPACGSKNSPTKAGVLEAENMPVWGFHGDIDQTVSKYKTINMVNAINATPPKPVAKCTIYPNVKHNCWDLAFKPDHTVHNPNVYDWMLSYTNTINAANKIPVCNAGTDKSITSTGITLTGAGTDIDGVISTYSWVKISGPTAKLVNATTSRLAVSGMTPGKYIFKLRVTDNKGDGDSDYVKVTVQ